MNFTILNEYGIDYEKGLTRCLNDNGFYEKLLIMFLDDDTFIRAKKAFGENDFRSMFKSLHELKGVCGNAAFVELYDEVCPLVEYLRGNVETSSVQPAQVSESFSKIETAYDRVISGITFASE